LPLSTLPVISLSLNTTMPTQIEPLSLHDALPILPNFKQAVNDVERASRSHGCSVNVYRKKLLLASPAENIKNNDSSRKTLISPKIGKHTSELQSPDHLVCRLLLEKKKKSIIPPEL